MNICTTLMKNMFTWFSLSRYWRLGFCRRIHGCLAKNLPAGEF